MVMGMSMVTRPVVFSGTVIPSRSAAARAVASMVKLAVPLKGNDTPERRLAPSASNPGNSA